MRRTVFIITAALMAAGCREGVAPWAPPEVERPDEPVRQITFGTGQDRDPVWMPDGNVLLYHTDQYGPLPTARGALLRIDGSGGAALPILEQIQRTGLRLLATPAVSPDGSQVAYIEVISIDGVVPCSAPAPPLLILCPTTQPVLDSAALRVRRFDATSPPLSDPSVGIQFAGRDPEIRTTDKSEYTMQAFPFQQMFRDDQTLVIRPSWAPDNQRIVFSDGLNLRIWRVGDAASTVIPGTLDGVSPAWSPAGDRIAFTHLERVDSTAYTCTECMRMPDAPMPTAEAHHRVSYTTRPRVYTIQPDGTGRTLVGEGDDPAWSPDGQLIYMRSGESVVRVPAAGGAPVAIPQAAFGRSPAVSADGRWLAFARRKPFHVVDWDIWVVSLSP